MIDEFTLALIKEDKDLQAFYKEALAEEFKYRTLQAKNQFRSLKEKMAIMKQQQKSREIKAETF